MRDRGGAVSFTVDGVHPHDVGQVLDDAGIGGPGRAPLRLADVPPLSGAGHDPRLVPHRTTTLDDVAALLAGVEQVQRFFGVPG